MDFVNERTYLGVVESGKAEEFHRQYEAAIDKVREDFGRQHPIWIGGKNLLSKGGTFEDRSPCDQRILLGRFQKGTREDAKKAVRSARDSFESWAQLDYKERVRVFLRASDLVAQRKYLLAALMTFENGKNRFEAIADVDEAIDLVRWYCTETMNNQGFNQEMGRYTANERTRSILRPYGVWAVVSPFNFPLAITMGMATGAVLTGNTAVLKPASDTPFMALKMYEILADSGLPEGVLNFVTGPGATVGEELVKNTDVNGLVFTGSLDVGLKAFRSFTAGFPKPIITEMGGKNATIVTRHADMEKAVEGVAKAAFGFSGQKCSACSRVIIHKDIKEIFLRKLVSYANGLRVGDPAHRDVFMGPVINRAAFDKFKKSAVTAKRDGKILTGGKTANEGSLRYGYYVEPTIVDKLPGGHRFLREELFLPILAAVGYTSWDEGMELFNSVDYGLTGGIFTTDQKELDGFFEKAQAGTLYANRTMGATTGAIVGAQPFVGWKWSGISGKGAGGHYYLQQFLRERSQTSYL